MPEPLQTLSALSAKTSALVLIDLQRGILPFAQGPHSAEQVLSASARLAKRFRELAAPVVLAEDAMSSNDAAMHRSSVENVFPRLGRVRDTSTILSALTA